MFPCACAAATGAASAPPTGFERPRGSTGIKGNETVIEFTDQGEFTDQVRETQGMSAALPAELERGSAGPSESERLVDQLANRIGGLGVELADVAGNVQEVAQRFTTQSKIPAGPARACRPRAPARSSPRDPSHHWFPRQRPPASPCRRPARNG